MKNRFRFWIGLSIVLIYGVIAAGAIVRMTGSGMGCPDWPKCFGYLVPPTERTQLDWKPDHDYEAGQVIIVNEELRIALKDFRSSEQYITANWGHYTQHDYALFNPIHTWIEFINRLLGALGGLATLVVGVLSFWHWKKNKLIPLVAWAIIFGMGFQAWLGKTVVDSNLQPFKITIHMVMALIIVALLLYLYYMAKTAKKNFVIPVQLKLMAILALILTLVQIAMGTQVRQFVDEQIDRLGEGTQSLWLDPAPFLFYIHRSFSLLVTGLNIWLFLRLRKLNFPLQQLKQVLVLIGLEILTGILMYYFDFPFSSQPLHLLFASLLFGAQTYALFHIFQPTQSTHS